VPPGPSVLWWFPIWKKYAQVKLDHESPMFRGVATTQMATDGVKTATDVGPIFVVDGMLDLFGIV